MNSQVSNVIKWLIGQCNEESSSNSLSFLKSIIEVVKVVGNEMNKGYFNRQEAASFSLDILPQLFNVRSTDDKEKFCLFDVVFKTYLNYTGQKLTPKTLERLEEECNEIIKRLNTVCWNTNQLNNAFIMKRSDILNLNSILVANMEKEMEELSSEDTAVYMEKVQEQVDNVKELIAPIMGENWLPCLKNLHDLKEYLGQNISQGVSDIIKFCNCCIQYFTEIIKNNEKERAKQRCKLARSRSREKDLGVQKKYETKRGQLGKENLAKVSNFSISKANTRIDAKVTGNKGKKNKDAGTFLLKNAAKSK